MLLAACAAAGRALGQEPSVQQQLNALQQMMREMQTRHQQEIDALKKEIADQHAVIDELKKNPSPAASPATAPATPPTLPAGKMPPASAPLFPTTDDSVLLPGAAATPAAPSPQIAPPTPGANGTPVIPTTDSSVLSLGNLGTGPITLAGGGKSYLNISFDAILAGAASSAHDLGSLEVGDHDPQKRGFNARNLELALDGAVDPYFEAFANIVFKLDSQNQTSVEVEEAFAQTTSLPLGLQVKAGQFFAPFGRINPTHPHTWDFVDAPLVHGRLLGPDGLRGAGAQISWVLPTKWYSQLMLAVQNGEGGTAYSFRNTGDTGTQFGRQTIDRQLNSVSDFAFIPRLEMSFDLSPTRTLLVGTSAAFGPNDTGPNARTQIYGVDAFYKWKSPKSEGGWPYVKWQTEAMLRRADAGLGANASFPVRETLTDWGVYSQIVWGFAKGWAAGLRGDYLHMQDSPFTMEPDRQSRWRISTDLTWYPSEFSKLRLQYNHDFLETSRFLQAHDEDSVFLQFEFALGAHGAHKF
jgi:hypothetical protein